MKAFVPILIILALLCVAGILFLGLYSMMKGGEFNEKYGNKLMQARIAAQGVVIILLAMAYYMSQN